MMHGQTNINNVKLDLQRSHLQPSALIYGWAATDSVVYMLEAVR
jgi:hypothetical protein